MRFWPKATRYALIITLIFEPVFLPFDVAHSADKPSSNRVPTSLDLPSDAAAIVFEESSAPFGNVTPDVPPQAPLDEEAKELEQAAPEAINRGLRWSDNKEALVETLLDLNFEISQLTEEIRVKHGEETLQDLINQGEVVVPRAGFGKAELNTCDGQNFVRVVHQPTGASILILPKKRYPHSPHGIDPESMHLRQIVARQHVESAGGKGRAVVKMWLIGDQVLETQYLPKSEAGYWRDYFYAKWKKPTKADFTMSLFAGAFMQGTLALMATALKTYVHPEQAFTWYPVVLTSIFGIGVGTFVSTYRNWTRTGTPTMRKIKASMVSLLFSYALVVGMNPGGAIDGVMSLNPLQWTGLAKNLTLLINAGVSNHTKDYWYQLQRYREELRENTKPFKPSIYLWTPSKGWHKSQIDTGWKQASLEHQIIYLIPWTLNILQIMGLVVGEIAGIKIPTWHLLSVPVAQYLLVRYAEYLADKKAQDPLALNRAEAREKADAIKTKWKSGMASRTMDFCGTLFRGLKNH